MKTLDQFFDPRCNFVNEGQRYAGRRVNEFMIVLVNPPRVGPASPVIYINDENLSVSVYFGAISVFENARATFQESANTVHERGRGGGGGVGVKNGRERERERTRVRFGLQFNSPRRET